MTMWRGRASTSSRSSERAQASTRPCATLRLNADRRRLALPMRRDGSAAVPRSIRGTTAFACLHYSAKAASECCFARVATAVRGGSEPQRCADGDHRSAPGVDGVNDLAAVDALQVDAGDAEVAVPELALDNDQRHALASALDRVGVAQLVRR